MSEQTDTVRPCVHHSGPGLPSRRQVVGGVAAAGGACFLAACGGSSSTGGSGGSGSSGEASSEGSSGGGETSAEGVPAADVSVGGGVIMGDADQPYVVTQPAEGEFKAFTATCTHTGCTVGSVENNEIICPCHGSRFDAASGEVLAGPASGPLDQLQVAMDGDTIVVS